MLGDRLAGLTEAEQFRIKNHCHRCARRITVWIEPDLRIECACGYKGNFHDNITAHLAILSSPSHNRAHP